ncbi:MAG: hypothetical protein HRU20_23145 [Pseudomonadales bacterium]|nr:hypothetical protein [Pseudomonadales bacterium]
MKNNSYAEFLVSQGKSVLSLRGVHWMNYQGALIPTNVMPVNVRLSTDDTNRALRETGALFLRYSTASTQDESVWWNMLCRHYDFNKVSSNTRSKIRRGNKRLNIRKVSAKWVSENAYECYVSCYDRYKNALPLSMDAFRHLMLEYADNDIFDIWASFQEEKLVGYILCIREENGVFMHTIDISPEGLKNYAAYMLINHVLEEYVCKQGLPVSNGSRSIHHDTQMQDFLTKFFFEREFADINVAYRKDIALIVRLLFPFRRWLNRCHIIPFIRKVSSVLYMEELVRAQQGIEA